MHPRTDQRPLHPADGGRVILNLHIAGGMMNIEIESFVDTQFGTGTVFAELHTSAGGETWYAVGLHRGGTLHLPAHQMRPYGSTTPDNSWRRVITPHGPGDLIAPSCQRPPRAWMVQLDSGWLVSVFTQHLTPAA